MKELLKESHNKDREAAQARRENGYKAMKDRKPYRDGKMSKN